MEKSTKNNNIIIILTTILVLLFYWFQLRPSDIRKECSKQASTPWGSILDKNYKDCLKTKGLSS